MGSRAPIASAVAALALAASPAAAMTATPVPAPSSGQPAAHAVPAAPEAILDLPDERTESDVFSYRVVLDDSTSDHRRPIVEQWLVITEPDGDRLVLAWQGRPGAHAQTSIVFDEPGTWTFTLTVTDLIGASDAVSETVEVAPDLSERGPEHGTEHPGA